MYSWASIVERVRFAASHILEANCCLFIPILQRKSTLSESVIRQLVLTSPVIMLVSSRKGFCVHILYVGYPLAKLNCKKNSPSTPCAPCVKQLKRRKLSITSTIISITSLQSFAKSSHIQLFPYSHSETHRPDSNFFRNQQVLAHDEIRSEVWLDRVLFYKQIQKLINSIVVPRYLQTCTFVESN